MRGTFLETSILLHQTGISLRSNAAEMPGRIWFPQPASTSLNIFDLKVICRFEVSQLSNNEQGTSLISLPGLISLRLASNAVAAACSTSAALPVTAPSDTSTECAATAMNPSMWAPRSLHRVWIQGWISGLHSK